jgi:hypothetical protein
MKANIRSDEELLTERDVVDLFPDEAKGTDFLSAFLRSMRSDMRKSTMECVFKIPKYSLEDVESGKVSRDFIAENLETTHETITRRIQLPR